MKEEYIKVIEESTRNKEYVSTDFRFTIILKPKKDSLEIKLWEKRYGLTDAEIINATDRTIIERIREDAAVEVFLKFYRDNFILNK